MSESAAEGAPFVVRCKPTWTTLTHPVGMCPPVRMPPYDPNSNQVLRRWVNSQDRYLAKYSALLAKHGCSSLRTIQSTAVGFAISEHGRQQGAENVLAFLADCKQAGGRQEHAPTSAAM